MTRREIPLDARTILQVLGEHVVDYVVIGGVAVQAHGHTRTTQDLDLVPNPDPTNLERLAAALATLHARPVGAATAPPQAPRLPAQGILELNTDHGGVDIHINPRGAAPYTDLRARAIKFELGGLDVFVAGRDDLIAMKRVSGRPIDRADIIVLTEPG